MRTIKLPDIFTNILAKLPESGMGYQLVKVILKNGRILHSHKVLNSEILMLEENEFFNVLDIDNIELELKK